MNRVRFPLFFLTIFLGSFLFVGVGHASAANYYVKNGGDDNAAGTSDATAWAHSPGMAGWTGTATLKSGDTVYFNSGDTWTGADPLLNATAGVTYDGSTYGNGTRATLQATSRVNGYGVVQIYVSNVVFKGFKIDSNKLL